ncbi:Flp family type IVb pilin [Aromatoleum toluvorans]|uniref:Flp family type IVb pilin n=1 Tax=Aromatoleum toluvorans TaxID=92002 RepID=A0ABX1PUD6_9RHOO|nr:Flp family type IVb pilin [Aromatoleum toluvorans]NMG43066.1 Flp family type IVb pilin [Aromatoleum toluvorans]
MKASRFKTLAISFYQEQDAVTAIEYALLASLIFAVIVTGVTLLGTEVKAMYDALAAAIPPQ